MLLARDAARTLRRSEVLLQRYLDIPDGVSVSPDRRWIAVSNHTPHNVHYPHGVRFSADGGHLFVADAGAPYLHVYAPGPDQWRGVRHPLATVRIMDDAAFERGRFNPEEGGPKGLDLDASSRVLVVTSECQPLAFFDVRALLEPALAGGSAREQSILGMGHELALMRESRRRAEKATEADALRNSRSWRITAPLRRLNAAFRRHRSLESHKPGQGEEHGRDPR